MEEKKDFINAMELDDNMLDSVAGGAGESGYKWNDGDEVKFTNGWKCHKTQNGNRGTYHI